MPTNADLSNPSKALIYRFMERCEGAGCECSHLAGHCGSTAAQSEPVHFIETCEESVMKLEDEPEFTEVEVALDSACARHVGSKADFPNYVVVEGDGSRRGQEFITAAGDTIRDEGEVAAAFLTQDKESINSTFQITVVTRPLWSVSQILDNLPAGHEANRRPGVGKVRATRWLVCEHA